MVWIKYCGLNFIINWHYERFLRCVILRLNVFPWMSSKLIEQLSDCSHPLILILLRWMQGPRHLLCDSCKFEKGACLIWVTNILNTSDTVFWEQRKSIVFYIRYDLIWVNRCYNDDNLIECLKHLKFVKSSDDSPKNFNWCLRLWPNLVAIGSWPILRRPWPHSTTAKCWNNSNTVATGNWQYNICSFMAKAQYWCESGLF